MRFEPIESLSLPLEKPECVERLVCDFGIKSWAYHTPMHLSELERLLVYGKSRERNNDFTNHRGTMLWSGDWIRVVDHACTFRCESGASFVLTMPYNTNEGFYRGFGNMMREYYAEKSEHAEFPQQDPLATYSTKGWKSQFAIDQALVALIIDDRYKIRENGDFAAIIATEETLESLRGLMR